MSRRHRAERREINPDDKFGDLVLAKFMNSLMYDGKKSAAEGIIYGAFDTIAAKTKQDPLVVFHEALRNVSPSIAVILCAAMSATASALNSLGTTSVVDFYKRSLRGGASDAHYLRVAKLFTILWGALAIAFAIGASLLENLIQAVNILGSLFYGPMLGVFLVGFFTRRVSGTAAFIAVLLAEAAVVAVWLGSSVGFLWYNVVGCGVVVAVTLASLLVSPRRAR